MTHDELLVKVKELQEEAAENTWYVHSQGCVGDCSCEADSLVVISPYKALSAVIELHKPQADEYFAYKGEDACAECGNRSYPCPTIEAVELNLQ
jgi:NAD-dependent dihydropyrimidine dehydrogenase PreA subunit